jgi:uncharacterized protein YggT (Ycf19 family)
MTIYLIRVVAASFTILILLSVLLSWVGRGRIKEGHFTGYLRFYTEPLLSPFRFNLRIPIDLSPIFAWLMIREFERLAIHIATLM